MGEEESPDLFGQGNLRDQDNGPLSAPECLLNRSDVKLGLAAPCNPIKKDGARLWLVETLLDDGEGFFLFGREVEYRCQRNFWKLLRLTRLGTPLSLFDPLWDRGLNRLAPA